MVIIIYIKRQTLLNNENTCTLFFFLLLIFLNVLDDPREAVLDTLGSERTAGLDLPQSITDGRQIQPSCNLCGKPEREGERDRVCACVNRSQNSINRSSK
eukprot:m.21719 g.21719  ORF g.21719 m.21719 type:complete len:100 (-) comp8748_c0_seq6:526-825(-)